MTEVFIQGFLGRDCTIQEGSNGTKFLSIAVGSSDFVKGTQKTQWFDCVWFGYNEKMVEYLKKGANVIAVGQLDVEMETGKDGATYIRRRVNVHSLSFVHTSNKQQGEDGETKQVQTAPQQTTKTVPTPPSDDEINVTSGKKPVATKTGPIPASTKPEPIGNDSDLPF